MHFKKLSSRRYSKHEMGYSMREKKLKSQLFSRTFYVDEDIKACEAITEKNVYSVRSRYELYPKCLKDVVTLKQGTGVCLNK